MLKRWYCRIESAAGAHARMQFMPEDHSDHLIAIHVLPSLVTGKPNGSSSGLRAYRSSRTALTQ